MAPPPFPCVDAVNPDPPGGAAALGEEEGTVSGEGGGGKVRTRPAYSRFGARVGIEDGGK